MIIKKLTLSNIKSFESSELTFSKSISILVGKNNSGKTTIFNSVMLLNGPGNIGSLLRLKGNECSVAFELYEGVNNTAIKDFKSILIKFGKDSGQTCSFTKYNGNNGGFSGITNREPVNLIQPYFNNRAAVALTELISLDAGLTVHGTFANLSARLDRLISNPEFPGHDLYKKLCKDAFGFIVGVNLSSQGKIPSLSISRDEWISVREMGAGTMQLVGLIVDILSCDNKLFLIEEPENDLHPSAIRVICEAIRGSSKNNQFLISTHSNVVINELGREENASVFKIECSLNNKIPTSSVAPVPDDCRIKLLSELGYELSDNSLWDYYIIFEESSAERIIRQFILPLFYPSLNGRVRTIASGGVSDVEVKLTRLNDFFVYSNLSPIYKNKCWVILDSGELESRIVAQLRIKYQKSGWSEGQFLNWEKHNFEDYYPSRFETDVRAINSESDKEIKRQLKKSLLEKLIKFYSKNPDLAKQEFNISANDVIVTIGKIFSGIL